MRELLAAAGVTELQGYRDRQPHPVPVSPVDATLTAAEPGV
jgi:hypothetical protein